MEIEEYLSSIESDLSEELSTIIDFILSYFDDVEFEEIKELIDTYNSDIEFIFRDYHYIIIHEDSEYNRALSHADDALDSYKYLIDHSDIAWVANYIDFDAWVDELRTDYINDIEKIEGWNFMTGINGYNIYEII